METEQETKTTEVNGSGRRFYDEEYRQEMIELYQQSGMSRREFALKEGLAYTTLTWWLNRKSVNKGGGAKDVGSGGIKLKAIDTKPLFSKSETVTQGVVEIIFGSVTVRLHRQ
jgi:transposase-like protein